MTDTTLVLTEEIWQVLTRALDDNVETAGVILAGHVVTNNELIFLARDVVWVPEEHYERREIAGLAIRSQGYVPALKRAADDGSVAIFFHTHPRGAPIPSRADDRVDDQLQAFFPIRTGQSEYLSLILGGTEEAPMFSGRVYRQGGEILALDRIRVVGRRLRILLSEDRHIQVNSDIYDRQVRAFGQAGQALLSHLRIGVVGAGGTGSAVCEQLIRLGVGTVTVIDDDRVSATNITRIYGSGTADIDKPKVLVVAANATRIGLGTRIRPYQGRITDPAVAQELRSCDLVFGCTDDHAGRAILSRLAYWYLVPVIDMGFLIDSADGVIQGLFGRISTVIPGTPCLICRGRIDPIMARTEVLPSQERYRLVAEGYAPELGEPDPAVVAYTTTVAALAVNELLDRLIGYGRTPAPSEIIIRLHERELRTVSTSARDGHYCTDRSNWGRGDSEPFLGQLWV